MSSIFISHATEDKEEVARPLAKALRDRGYSVWFDEYSVKLGTSLRQEIDKGLANCRFGIVILSESFFAKAWAQKELDALTAREATEGGNIVLPVWHKLTAEAIGKFSPLLAAKLGVSTGEGLPRVIKVICEVLGPPDTPTSARKPNDSLVYSFADRNVLDWRRAVEDIFPNSRPTSSNWTDRSEIIGVLAHVCRPNLNHCFFPSGGGLNLVGVNDSLERDCMELMWSSDAVTIIRPQSLRFESFPGFPSLSYFWIETDPLQPIEENRAGETHEELAEIFPLDYRPRSVLDDGYYDCDDRGKPVPLPKNTRVVTRYFRGSFVIFAKGSAYNGLRGRHDAYRGGHEKMGATAFRDFISDLIREVASREIELEPDRK